MPHLTIALLGTFQVCLEGQRVTTFPYDKVRALLAYLALEAGQAHRRETLVGLLWGERPERAARQSLSQALSLLRRALGDATALPPYLNVTRDTLQFNANSDYELDVATLTQHLAAAQSHPHARLAHCEPRLAHLEKAVALYGGDFLAGFSVGDSLAFEEWVRLQAEHLRFQVLEAMSLLAGSYLEQGDCDAALGHGRRQLALDPARESAHRQVMPALALDGHRSAALQQYEACCDILGADYSLEPDAKTRALYAEIRAAGPQCASVSDTRASASAPPHNLPAQLTPFVGRASELREIDARLQHPDCRLLTLVGTGGSGKTRLALEAACAQLASFPDGVYQVALVGHRTSAEVLSAIADAIGLVFHEDHDPKKQLLDFLRDKAMLLILDNFEHLVGESALVLETLRVAAQVKIVITSRVPLQA